jgi:hypothetical protein
VKAITLDIYSDIDDKVAFNSYFGKIFPRGESGIQAEDQKMPSFLRLLWPS